MKHFYTLFIIGALSAAFSSSALALTQYQKISAGTGFLVNRNGDVVTNAHVVKNCESITVRTERGEEPATLRASDDDHDLAIVRLDAGNSGGSMAPLRWNISELKISDPVIVMGYPGKQGLEGRYVYKKTVVKDLTGPTGEPLWIQLGSVVQQGNSGGPVLDTTGNVIAVISGMALTYKADAQGKPIYSDLVGQSDIAITLASLRDFLNQNNVEYYEASSGLIAHADPVIERSASQFIRPVHCIQGTITQ